MSELVNEVEAAVKAVEAEAKTVAEAVVTETKEVVAKVEEKAKAALVQLVADEKLFLREAELEFVKAQMEIQRLSTAAQAKSKAYTDFVEQLYVKYGLTKAEYIFDGAVAQFKKL